MLSDLIMFRRIFARGIEKNSKRIDSLEKKMDFLIQEKYPKFNFGDPKSSHSSTFVVEDLNMLTHWNADRKAQAFTFTRALSMRWRCNSRKDFLLCTHSFSSSRTRKCNSTHSKNVIDQKIFIF